MLLLHLWTKHKSSRWASVRFRTTWNDCFEVPEQLLKKEKKSNHRKYHKSLYNSKAWHYPPFFCLSCFCFPSTTFIMLRTRFLNKRYLTLWAESRQRVSQAGACLCAGPVINCEWLCLYCAPCVLSLSQADEWLWLVLSFPKWPWEMIAAMFLQTLLYSAGNECNPHF